MQEIIKIMKKRATALKKAISRAKQDRGKFPEGNLRISYSNDRTRYYVVTDKGDSNGTYIKKEDRELAFGLAMKDYNTRFLKDAAKELARLEECIKALSKSNADLSFQKLSPHRKDLVTPYLVTDELYAAKWQAKSTKSEAFMTDNLIYDTRRGEKVRSKSEAIIADTLYDLGIPYFYEKKLVLKDGSYRCPDFTILHVKKRQEYYLEHFGLLDQPEYLSKSLQKLDDYRANGIYPGKNFLFTYETEDAPLDIKGIRRMLKEVFGSEDEDLIGK